MHMQLLNGAWEFRQAHSKEWQPATVPGGAHTDLLSLGMIPDPFVADNEKRVQWIAEADWEYRRTFSISPDLLQEERVDLVCEGLDTLARVYVNGKLLGRGENMFRQYRWNAKPLLVAGKNEISVYFESTVKYVTEREQQRSLKGSAQAIPGGPYVRKAPCQFGWDWGPMLPPVGIWKDIYLVGVSIARLEDVHLRQIHKEKKVTLEAGLKLERLGGKKLTVCMRVTPPKGRELVTETELDGDAGKLSVPINNPKLWWLNGYGDQPLYQVQVDVLDGDCLLDRKTFQVGLRTIEVRQTADEWGESFSFVVNGVPIFAKGSDWIPTDSFPTRITTQTLEEILGSAAATHQNMLRVWGGGFYETETFYDICDRLGILIWQDCVYACAIYPMDDTDFLENVRIETVENVRRLRHRASLALWCGNNEMEWGWEAWSWSNPDSQDLKDAYEKFFFHTLPEWIAMEDPDNFYWPSSPSSNTPFKDVNGQTQGDAHYWDVWHGRKPFTAYRSQYPRFMSEFGFQSLPPLDTIRTYAEEKDWNMTSFIMEYHQRSGSGNGLMMGQMTDTFRMPKDFPALVYLSMMLQAEGIRYGVEHWRRNMQRVSGTLYWQLNDC
jgi:beta-mannosidase